MSAALVPLRPLAAALALVAGAGLILCLVAGRWRWAFAPPLALAGALWAAEARPPALISGEGGLVGLLGPEGRALSQPKGQGFAAASWLENDGDLADQDAAAARPGFDGPATARRFRLGEWQGVRLRGKAALADLAGHCATADLVILADRWEGPPPEGCTLIDTALLRRTGPLALWPLPDGRLQAQPTTRQQRLWQPRPTLAPLFIEKGQALRP